MFISRRSSQQNTANLSEYDFMLNLTGNRKYFSVTDNIKIRLYPLTATFSVEDNFYLVYNEKKIKYGALNENQSQ